MSDSRCEFRKIEEDGRVLKCKKKSVTFDGFCKLHANRSVETRVTETNEEENELGIGLYDKLVEGEIENEIEIQTTENPRKEVI